MLLCQFDKWHLCCFTPETNLSWWEHWTLGTVHETWETADCTYNNLHKWFEIRLHMPEGFMIHGVRPTGALITRKEPLDGEWRKRKETWETCGFLKFIILFLWSSKYSILNKVMHNYEINYINTLGNIITYLIISKIAY